MMENLIFGAAAILLCTAGAIRQGAFIPETARSVEHRDP
jgi:hypothetical protein